MAETSCPQESADPLPADTTCSVPQQREPSAEYTPWGTPWHHLTAPLPD